MRIAVITPLSEATRPWLQQCLDSVARQTVPCTHFLVCDGVAPDGVALPARVQVIRLPLPHADGGLTARAIGAVSAIRQGCDAVAFLDAGSWYEPAHIELLCEELRRTGAAVCSSGRALHDAHGALLGVCPAVDGEHFAATDCLLLTRPAFGLLAAWYLLPLAQAPAGEQALWAALKDAGLKRAHHGRPTVHARTPPPVALPSAALPRALAPPRAAAPRGRVSLCMIVKDEEANLADCLRPVLGLVDEIIVADTGSADRTRAVARELGAQVVDFPWCDSFAAARNEALRHTTGEWVFFLDADDRLDAANVARLRRLFGQLADDDRAYLMNLSSAAEHAAGSALVVGQVRLFRKRPGIGWRYRVHEQILPALCEAGAQVVWTDVVIQHTGYRDAGTRARKLARNLRLLELEQAEHPDDAFTRFNLGGTYLDRGEFAAALPHLRRCVETAAVGATYLPKAYGLLAQAQRMLGRLEDGLRACREGRARHPDDAELCFEEGLVRQAAGDAVGAQRCFEHILEMPASPSYVGVDSGLRGHLTRHHLAIAHRDQGRWPEAEAQWRAALAACPEFGPAWLGLAEACLEQGRPGEAEALVERLAGAAGAGPAVAAVRARLCLARGDAPMARRVLQEGLAAAPHALWLRLLLGEILLRRGQDLDEAERQFAAVLAIDPKQKRARDRLAQVEQLRTGAAGTSRPRAK